MYKVLAKSIREFKKQSIMTPILIAFEVLIEVTIPFIIALLVNEIKSGCELRVILWYGLILVVLAGLSLTFGVLAGNTCAVASAGFGKNLRKDILAYSDRLCLNPKALENVTAEKEEKSKLASVLSKLQ